MGLKDSIDKISWKDNNISNTLRYVIHIAEAPPHGRDFCKNSEDGFPNGCPCGTTLK